MGCEEVNWMEISGYEPMARAFSDWCALCYIALLIEQN
jgi:hypothetical protein